MQKAMELMQCALKRPGVFQWPVKVPPTWKGNKVARRPQLFVKCHNSPGRPAPLSSSHLVTLLALRLFSLLCIGLPRLWPPRYPSPNAIYRAQTPAAPATATPDKRQFCIDLHRLTSIPYFYIFFSLNLVHFIFHFFKLIFKLCAGCLQEIPAHVNISPPNFQCQYFDGNPEINFTGPWLAVQ